MEGDIVVVGFALLAIFAGFTLSASAGLGGSLIVVPALVLLLGAKEGVALAALLLAGNNLMKIFAYRRSLPFRPAAGLIILLTIGTAVGATLLVRAPEKHVGIAVIAAFVITLASERRDWTALRRIGFPVLSFGAGATSGFAGTSGPLKGAALRNIDLDRAHFVGAASLASLAGDLTKSAIFAEAELLDTSSLFWLVAVIPLMLLGTALGRRLNQSMGERAFALMFWTVMVGYSVRLAAAL